MAKLDVAYVDNTNNLLLSDLKSTLEDSYLDEQSVTVTIKDDAGEEVAGEVWPLTMTFLANGNYVVALSALLAFEDGKTYTAEIDVNASDTNYERIAHWEFPFEASKRTGQS